MPELNSQNMEHRVLEADIERLSKEIAEKRNLLEHKDLSARELVKKSLEPMFKQDIGKPAAVQFATQSATQNQIIPDYLKNASPEIKLLVEELVNSLFHQGVEKVVKRAKRANPFILDAFHDALTDKLHQELKNRKLI